MIRSMSSIGEVNMTNYANGTRIEYIARNQLIADGYDVMRAAGSKGCVDLIAWSIREIRFIQVKKEGERRRKYTEDYLGLQKLNTPPCKASFEIWVWKKNRGWKEKVVVKESWEILKEA